MNTFRRISVAARRRAAVTRAAIRRRPRTFAAAGVLVAVIALSGASGLVLVSSAPPATTTTTNGDPAFTVRGGWTLADLERHVEAGDVDAITAASATASDPAGKLLARTRSGQVVPIELSVGASAAVAALTSLGYGNLMTTEAIQVTSTGATASPTASALAIVVPLLLLAVLIAFVMRMSRRTRSAGRDGGSKFSIIMPPDPNAPEQVASLDGTFQPVVRIALADVAGCDEAKFELTETIEFLKTP